MGHLIGSILAGLAIWMTFPTLMSPLSGAASAHAARKRAEAEVEQAMRRARYFEREAALVRESAGR